MEAAIVLRHGLAHLLAQALGAENGIEDEVLELRGRSGRKAIFRNVVTVTAAIQVVGNDDRVLTLRIDLLPAVLAGHLQSHYAIELSSARIDADTEAGDLRKIALALGTAAIPGFTCRSSAGSASFTVRCALILLKSQSVSRHDYKSWPIEFEVNSDWILTSLP